MELAEAAVSETYELHVSMQRFIKRVIFCILNILNRDYN